MIRSIILVFSLVLAASPAIDPKDYIWFNYGTKSQITAYTPSYYQVPMPCEAKIGECKVKFTLVPPGWISQNNNILIPSIDAFKTGTYAVQASASEITGEKIDVSLILDLNSGFVTIYDRGQFFNKNGFTDTTVPLIQISTQSPFNPVPTPTPKIPTSIPASFPSLSSVQAAINAGNIITITNTVTSILTVNGSCNTKLAYFQGVLNLFNNKISSITSDINSLNVDISFKNNQIKLLLARKQQILVEVNNQEIIALQSQIESLNATRSQYYLNYDRYVFVANSLLAKLNTTFNGFSTNSNTLINQEISALQKQLADINDEANDLISQKKAILNDISLRNLTSIKNLISSKGNPALLNALESQYVIFSENIALEKTEFQNLEYRMAALEQIANQGQIKEKVNQAKVSPPKNNSALNELLSLKNILNSNAKSLSDQKISLKSSCLSK